MVSKSLKGFGGLGLAATLAATLVLVPATQGDVISKAVAEGNLTINQVLNDQDQPIAMPDDLVISAAAGLFEESGTFDGNAEVFTAEGTALVNAVDANNLGLFEGVTAKAEVDGIARTTAGVISWTNMSAATNGSMTMTNNSAADTYTVRLALNFLISGELTGTGDIQDSGYSEAVLGIKNDDFSLDIFDAFVFKYDMNNASQTYFNSGNEVLDIPLAPGQTVSFDMITDSYGGTGVPEPSTVMLLLAGLGALVIRKRMR